MSRQASSAKAGGACSFSITAQAGPARYFLAWQPCTELLSESLAGEGFALPGRVTFSLRAQRESNQRESTPRHPGLIALGRSDFPRSGAAPGAGRDGPSMARLCLARPSWPLTPCATPPLGLLSGARTSALPAGLASAGTMPRAPAFVGRISRRRNPTFMRPDDSAVGLRRFAANRPTGAHPKVQARDPPLPIRLSAIVA